MKKVHTLLLSMTLSFAMATCTIPALWAKADGATGASNGVTMYRLYNPNSGEHFYTGNETEKTDLVKAGWSDEGIGWIAPVKSNTPVYRLYNGNAGDHHYTLDAKEKDSLVSAGWKSEDIGWYSDDDKTVPLYREYNPNAVTGTHNYTTDKAEHMNLVKAGWRDEGIGWYGIPEKTTGPVFPTAKIGDIVTFGAYEQDNDLTNGPEPIEWQYVADRDGHKLLLAKYALDSKQYNSELVDITWEDCTLRKWLNRDFYDTAFSISDKGKIVTAHNENPDSYEFWKGFDCGAEGGNDTYDNVFLLSWTEARDYFEGKREVYQVDKYEDLLVNYNPQLLCKPTAYALTQGVYTNDASESIYPSDTDGCCSWWLRSPGDYQIAATVVHPYGSLTGNNVDFGFIGVRPAILID